MATAMSQTTTTDYELGFQSLEEETAVDSLPVSGAAARLARAARSCA